MVGRELSTACPQGIHRLSTAHRAHLRRGVIGTSGGALWYYRTMFLAQPPERLRRQRRGEPPHPQPPKLRLGPPQSIYTLFCTLDTAFLKSRRVNEKLENEHDPHPLVNTPLPPSFFPYAFLYIGISKPTPLMEPTPPARFVFSIPNSTRCT